MKFFQRISIGKIFVLLIAVVFSLNFIIPAIQNRNASSSSSAEGGDKKDTTYEIDKSKEWGNTMLNITMWDEDMASASDLAQIANLAKDFGYTGVDYSLNWYNFQKSLSGEDMYDFKRIDSRLEAIIAKAGMMSCLSVFFTSGYYEKNIGDAMMEGLKWQQTADGNVYFKDNYGAAPCVSDEYTKNTLVNAFKALCTHLFEKYGTNVTRVEARISQYGELEYFSSANTALDYSDSAMDAFVAYLKEKFATVSALCDTYGNTVYRNYSWDALENALKTKDNSTNVAVTDAFDFDWQEFRQREIMSLAKAFTDASHQASVDAQVKDKNGNQVFIPFAFQVGSVYDSQAYSLRGTYDPYLMGKNSDIVHTDDAPLFDHNFSADFMMVDDNHAYASEIDGYWHVAMKGDAARDGFKKQAQSMGASGVKYLNTANWNYAAMFKERDLLKAYAELFFNSPKKEYVGQVNPAHANSAILINTADLIYKKIAAESELMLGGFYNQVTDHGTYKMKFITDTQILDDPAILDKYTTLYLGGVYNNEYYVRGALIDLLKSKGTELKPYTNAGFALKNEYGRAVDRTGLNVVS